ncbi:LTA synthase family protein [Mesoterricola silvestris]|uniref:Sulfatase N-terminal domain-containing protein n=1 Tax=Mesoterricola silvestris TaxID=2927979 RepID=A0AA48GNC7_9BACT|nr:LTA synthase family protein [Mesoterricola silvestris]BDU70997.1 hypothetical protein METEAL_01710 [Mesoterricola silvestris]
MHALRSALEAVRPSRHQWTLFGLWWFKLLVFYAGLFSVDHLHFHLGILNREIFRSLLRPAYHSLVLMGILALLNAFPERRRNAAFGVLSALVSCLLLVDLGYYRAFRALPSLGILSAVGGLSLPLDHLTPLLRPWDLLLFLDLPLVAALGRWFPAPAPGGFRRLALQACGCAGLFLLVPLFGGGVLGSPGAREPLTLAKPVDLAVLVTPFGFHALDFASFLQKGRRFVPLDPGERERIRGWLRENDEGLPPGPAAGLLKGRNLLVIQVESLEAFVLGQTAGGVPVTPNLDALRRRGLSFSRFHEQVNLGMSSDADLMTNTSVYPVRREATFASYPTATLPSLPRILGERGYATLSLHPDPGSFWNVGQGLSHLGFQRSVDAGRFDCGDSFGMGLSDASFLAQALPLVTALREPFYAFMVTLSSHEPFHLPDYLRELPLDPALDRSPMGDYLQSVHYTDKHLGLFLRGLEREGLLRRTVVVVTGDHQGVHKYYEKELLASPLAQPWWGSRDHRIPLLIAAHGLAPRELDIHGGQVDLMPTLLGLLGIDPGEERTRMMGRDLLNTGRNLAVLADGTLVGSAGAGGAFHCREGLEVADLIIRGDYFRDAGAALGDRARSGGPPTGPCSRR